MPFLPPNQQCQSTEGTGRVGIAQLNENEMLNVTIIIIIIIIDIFKVA